MNPLQIRPVLSLQRKRFEDWLSGSRSFPAHNVATIDVAGSRREMDDAALWMPGESEEEGRSSSGTETRVVHDDESPDITGEAPSNGYHTQGQEGYEEEEEDDGLMVAHRGEAEEPGHEDPPQSQEMPQEFYSGVESFLSRPAPSLDRVIASPPHNNTHPPRQSTGVARPPALPTPTHTNTNTTNISNKANVRSGSGIDPLLLAEAFAYAQRLQHIMTGQQEGDALSESRNQVGLAGVKQLRKTRSHNQQQMAAMGVGHSSHSTGGSTGTHRRRTSEPTLLTSTGMARVLGPRSKPQAVHKKPNSTTKKASTAAKNVHKECEWSLGVGERNADMNTGTIRQHDMQTMVSNFEAKSTIQQLRRELEESQASMHRSEAIIRSVVHDFYGPSTSTSTQHPPPFVV